MKITDIETPALILEKSIFDKNRRVMASLLSGSSMALRPHYKSHKCPAIALIQLSDGAKGLTCAKLSEAEDLADAGVSDILIANQIIDEKKLSRLASLAGRCRLTVCVESADNVLALAHAASAAGTTVHVLIEYEIGMQRCGVESHEEVLALARLISEQKSLRYEGIQAYAGNMAHEKSLEVRQAATDAIEADLAALKAELTAAGLPPAEISGVSTGTVQTKPKASVYTEMQCGSYLFSDRAYRDLHLCFENALFLLTTVMSVKPSRIVTDGGVKSLGMDQGNPVVVGYEDYPVGMSEEHSQIEVPGHSQRVGDRLRLIPGHCCTTFNLHDRVYLVDGEDVVDCWEITSRGRAQ